MGSPIINSSVTARTIECGHSSASLNSVAACSDANAKAAYARVHCAILCSLMRAQRLTSHGVSAAWAATGALTAGAATLPASPSGGTLAGVSATLPSSPGEDSLPILVEGLRQVQRF